MDGGYENASINLHKEFITPSNINDLFAKYRVPKVFDFLSIDVDYGMCCRDVLVAPMNPG